MASNNNRDNDNGDAVLLCVRQAVDKYLEDINNDNESDHVALLELRGVGVLHGQSLIYLLQQWRSGSGLCLNACKVQDVAPLVAFLSRNSVSNLTHFELLNNPFHAHQQCVDLLEALKICRVPYVDLSGGTMETWGRVYGAVVDNEFQNFDEGKRAVAQALLDLILEADCLETLILCKNRFDLLMAQNMGIALAGSQRCARGKRPVPPPTLRNLDLSGCGLTDEMLRALLQPSVDRAESLGGGCRLRSLKLCQNKLTHESVPILTKYLANFRARSLRELDLSCNRDLFRRASLEDVAPFFQVLTSKQLSVEKFNAVGTILSAPILDVFWNWIVPQGRLCKLTHLGLSIPASGVPAVVGALPRIHTIQEFHCVMPYMEYTPSKRIVWEKALASNTSLFRLYPLQGYKDSALRERLNGYFRRNRFVHKTHKLFQESSATGGALWAEALHQLRTKGGPSGLHMIVQLHFSELQTLIQ